MNYYSLLKFFLIVYCYLQFALGNRRTCVCCHTSCPEDRMDTASCRREISLLQVIRKYWSRKYFSYDINVICGHTLIKSVLISQLFQFRSRCRHLHPVDLPKMKLSTSTYFRKTGNHDMAMITAAFLSAIKKGAHFIFQANPGKKTLTQGV